MTSGDHDEINYSHGPSLGGFFTRLFINKGQNKIPWG